MKIISRTSRKINGNWYARVRYEDDNGKKGESYCVGLRVSLTLKI
jgi:hypothetical protein